MEKSLLSQCEEKIDLRSVPLKILIGFVRTEPFDTNWKRKLVQIKTEKISLDAKERRILFDRINSSIAAF